MSESLTKQLERLIELGNEHGLTEATDFLKSFLRKYDVVKNKEKVKK